MLIFALGAILACCPRASAPPAAHADAMTDTTRERNSRGLPFTREEYVAAKAQVWPLADAEEWARRLFEPDPEVIGVTMMDGDLILLALLSDDLARRMVSFRPALKDPIERTRANREEVLRQWRQSIARDAP